jgi:excisionase family DNA binding protein
MKGKFEMEETLTTKQLSAYLKVSRGTITNLIRDGSIPFFRVRAKYLFLKKDVDNFLSDNYHPANREVKI